MYYFEIKTDMNSVTILFRSKRYDSIDEIKEKIKSLLDVVYNKSHEGFIETENYNDVICFIPSTMFKNYIEIRKD